MLRRVLMSVLILCLLLPFTSGCCTYWSAKKEMDKAETALAELKAKGGATKVPYEYCSAESFLEASKFVLNENSWKVSREFSARSKSAAEAGLAEVRKRK